MSPIPSRQIPCCIPAELLERGSRVKGPSSALILLCQQIWGKIHYGNRALTRYKNSHWTANPDSQYQQQQFAQVERLILVTVNTGDSGNPLQKDHRRSWLLSWHIMEADQEGSGAFQWPAERPPLVPPAGPYPY